MESTVLKLLLLLCVGVPVRAGPSTFTIASAYCVDHSELNNHCRVEGDSLDSVDADEGTLHSYLRIDGANLDVVAPLAALSVLVGGRVCLNATIVVPPAEDEEPNYIACRAPCSDAFGALAEVSVTYGARHVATDAGGQKVQAQYSSAYESMDSIDHVCFEPPIVTSISPASPNIVVAGDLITVTGSNFGPANPVPLGAVWSVALIFGGHWTETVVSYSATEIVFALGEDVGEAAGGAGWNVSLAVGQFTTAAPASQTLVVSSRTKQVRGVKITLGEPNATHPGWILAVISWMRPLEFERNATAAAIALVACAHTLVPGDTNRASSARMNDVNMFSCGACAATQVLYAAGATDVSGATSLAVAVPLGATLRAYVEVIYDEGREDRTLQYYGTGRQTSAVIASQAAMVPLPPKIEEIAYVGLSHGVGATVVDILLRFADISSSDFRGGVANIATIRYTAAEVGMMKTIVIPLDASDLGASRLAIIGRFPIDVAYAFTMQLRSQRIDGIEVEAGTSAILPLRYLDSNRSAHVTLLVQAPGAAVEPRARLLAAENRTFSVVVEWQSGAVLAGNAPVVDHTVRFRTTSEQCCSVRLHSASMCRRNVTDLALYSSHVATGSGAPIATLGGLPLGQTVCAIVVATNAVGSSNASANEVCINVTGAISAACALGSFLADPTQTQCAPCPLGRWGSEKGRCDACVSGTFTATTGRTACATCDAEFHLAVSTDRKCMPCPKDRTSCSGGVSNSRAVVAPNSWHRRLATCAPLRGNASTTGLEFAPCDGTACWGDWVLAPDESFNVYECPLENACINVESACEDAACGGRFPQLQCAEGHKGALCASCCDTHALVGQACLACPTDQRFNTALASLLVVGVAGVVTILVVAQMCGACKRMEGTLEEALSSDVLRIFMNWMQTASSLASVRAKPPALITDTIKQVSAVTDGLSLSSYPIQCLMKWDILFVTALDMISPVLSLVLPFFVVFLAFIYLRLVVKHLTCSAGLRERCGCSSTTRVRNLGPAKSIEEHDAEDEEEQRWLHKQANTEIDRAAEESGHVLGVLDVMRLALCVASGQTKLAAQQVKILAAHGGALDTTAGVFSRRTRKTLLRSAATGTLLTEDACLIFKQGVKYLRKHKDLPKDFAKRLAPKRKKRGWHRLLYSTEEELRGDFAAIDIARAGVLGELQVAALLPHGMSPADVHDMFEKYAAPALKGEQRFAAMVKECERQECEDSQRGGTLANSPSAAGDMGSPMASQPHRTMSSYMKALELAETEGGEDFIANASPTAAQRRASIHRRPTSAKTQVLIAAAIHRLATPETTHGRASPPDVPTESMVALDHRAITIAAYFRLARNLELQRMVVLSITGMVMVFYFTYMRLAISLIRLFDWTEVEGTLLLTSDMSIEIGTPRHAMLMAAAPVSALSCIVGAPLLVWALLYKNRKRLGDSRVATMFGFLLDGYREECWWWEFIVLLRKIPIAAIAYMGGASAFAQSAFASTILSISLAAHCFAWPYEEKTLNTLEALGLLALLISQQGGMVHFYYQQSDERDEIKQAVSVTTIIVLALVNGGMMLLFLATVCSHKVLDLRAKVRKWKEKKKLARSREVWSRARRAWKGKMVADKGERGSASGWMSMFASGGAGAPGGGGGPRGMLKIKTAIAHKKETLQSPTSPLAAAADVAAVGDETSSDAHAYPEAFVSPAASPTRAREEE